MRVIAALLAAGLAAMSFTAVPVRAEDASQGAPQQAAPSDTESQAAVKTAEQPLTKDRTEAFVEAMEEIHPKIVAFREAEKKAGKEPDPGALKEQQAELLAIVKKHGFDKASWNATGDRVVQAYSFARMEQEGKKVEDQISKAEARVQQDPKMPEDQKTQLLAALEKTREQYRHAAGDKQAVLPFMDRLKKIFAE